MIDKTNQFILEKLKSKYEGHIIGYEYRYWKEGYLAPPPPRAFCQSFTRYRNCCEVTYIVLDNGKKVIVSGLGTGTEVDKNFKGDYYPWWFWVITFPIVLWLANILNKIFG